MLHLHIAINRIIAISPANDFDAINEWMNSIPHLVLYKQKNSIEMIIVSKDHLPAINLFGNLIFHHPSIQLELHTHVFNEGEEQCFSYISEDHWADDFMYRKMVQVDQPMAFKQLDWFEDVIQKVLSLEPYDDQKELT